jgi:aminoglycoside phosphotransferase (APT) family kinase protein
LLKKLFKELGITDVNSIEKIEVGFANDVYSVDDKYIFKIAKDKLYSDYIKKDIYYCRLFQNKLPVPKVLYTGELDGKAYFIYKKIKGDNLYDVWHLSNEKQRESYIKQICDILRAINGYPYEDLGKSWQEFVYSKMIAYIKLFRGQGILDKKLTDKLRSYIEKNKKALEIEKIALVDWDLHFDNLLVSGGKIVGRLDFERVMTASLDYQMVLVKRMVRNPKKYASENAEKFVVVKDYANLMNWYKEFYPEMFEFPEIDMRLNLYAILMCLDDIAIFDLDEQLKDEIAEYLDL